MFEVRNEHSNNLKQNSQFIRPLVRSVHHQTKSFPYLGSIVWDTLLQKTIKYGNLRAALVELCPSKYIENSGFK